MTEIQETFLPNFSANALSFGELTSSLKYTAKSMMHPAEVVHKLARDVENFARFPDKSQGPQREYSWEEVAKCDGEDGHALFIVFEGSVYDITEFADFHPVGPKPLKLHAGQDATLAMRVSGMPKMVFDVLLKRFLVGWIQ
ncbi:hypothetical protein ACJJTC_018671 [Scirpophaga incertulas]